MPTRRRTMLGLGQLLFGGVAVSTGAFDASATTSSALRIMAVFDLELAPGRENERYVDTDDDGRVVAINLDGTDTSADGINRRARTRFENLVELVNNGDTPVYEIHFEFEVTDTGLQAGDPTTDEIEAALQIVSATGEIDATGDVNFFDISEDEDVDDGELNPGDGIPFGVQIDLLPNSGPGTIDSLPPTDRFDVTLHIRATMD